MTTNPVMRRAVRIFALVVAVTLLIGCSVFFFPETLGSRWPWPLAPFNARFLGAVYISEFVGVFMLMAIARWSPGRLAILLGITFTGLVTLVSLFHLEQFNFARIAPAMWFILYGGSVLILASFLWTHRHLTPVTGSISPAWRTYLRLQAGVYGLYSLGLLFLPGTFGAFWPWPIDAFHSQVYSAAFLSGAVGAYLLSRSGAPLDFLMFGLSQIALGLFAVLGTLIVDSQVHRVDWSLPGAWLWVGMFAVLFLAGLAMVVHWYRLRQPEAVYAVAR